MKNQPPWVQNRVSNHSWSPQNQEDTRRQGPQTPKERDKYCRKAAENNVECQEIYAMDSDEDNEEPQKRAWTLFNISIY